MKTLSPWWLLLSLICLQVVGLKALAQTRILTGADQISQWQAKLTGKRFGLCVNHTATVGRRHLLDTLISLGHKPDRLFSPEHGIRGTADAGALIASGTDQQSGLPIISLYGKNKKPKPDDLKGLDLVIFDMQDVGVRFYTYISTMHYVMAACAEQGIKVMVLDRPNPLGGIIDGPVLTDTSLRSFVGMHPIPVIHGLTVGELALMINGEGWLGKRDTAKVKCDLEVVKIGGGYNHSQAWPLKVAPSPNLKNDHAISLYPSLCLFEGTPVSVGRGTPYPFEVYGLPDSTFGTFRFIPQPMNGATDPLYKGKACYGQDLRTVKAPKQLEIKWLIDAYKHCSPADKVKFFTPFFNKLAGNKSLAEQIKIGMTEEAIRKTWVADLEAYKSMRKRYLLYP